LSDSVRSPLENNNPIGIFDSGVGGLTVAKAVSQLLPNEKLIYFGDTAHLPYGDKSPRSIRFYSEKISSFFLEKNCKAIIIACNSASSLAFKHLNDLFGDKVILINVIDPVVDYVTANDSITNVGVIGTKATIQSNVYQQKINHKKDEVNVSSLATSLFVPMIEEGFIECDLSDKIIQQYLSDKTLSGIDALILGCTHYPLIKKEIEKYFDNKVMVVDSASVVADYAKDVLKDRSLLNSSTPVPEYEFYVSDYTEFFESITKVFFDEQIKLQLNPIWDTV